MAIRRGSTGNDTINGTAGWDTLYGLAGNDTLIGGTGNDILSGGDGNDTFKYLLFSEVKDDSIVDFNATDRIDFSTIAAAGRHFIGNAQFNGIAGEIRYADYIGSDTSITIDSDGDAQSDYAFTILGQFNFIETVANSGILIAAANQTLTGTALANTLNGGAGKDTLSGLTGNDTLIGGEGNDRLLGGDGADILIGGRGKDDCMGGAGNDTFRFTAPDDIANDTITDFARGDAVHVTIQDINYIGDAYFTGFPGEYRYAAPSGSSQNGQIQFDFNGDKEADDSRSVNVNAGAAIMLQESSPGSNNLVAATNRILTGTAGNNTLTGGNGNDNINGMAGNDLLNGGMGRDRLLGDIGNDTLNGGSGNDALNGGDGADRLVGGLGRDTLTGGAGNDIFKYTALAEISNQNTHSYSTPDNADRISDMTAGDRIDLSAIPDLSFVGIGNDFSGTENEIRITNDHYITILDVDTNGDKSENYSLSLTGNLILEETAPGSKIFQVTPDRTLPGTSANDTLTGGNGNDSISGLIGNDILSGGYGDDTLNGAAGADTLIGGLGQDTLTGGAGNDIFKYNVLAEISDQDTYGYGIPGNADSISDLAGGDRIDLSAIPDLSFVGVGNDFSGAENEICITSGFYSASLDIDIDGDMSADYSLRLNGNPSLEETAPGSLIFQIPTNLTLNGTSANDALTGNNGNDTLNGLIGTDRLSGGYGDDTLNGGTGTDTLIGGLGVDILTGGAGYDIFRFTSLNEIGFSSNARHYDTITDFATGDKIDLAGVDANTTLANNQTFTFVGANAFTGTAGELRCQYGVLEGDVNGNSIADFSITLTGYPYISPVATDFIL